MLSSWIWWFLLQILRIWISSLSNSFHVLLRIQLFSSLWVFLLSLLGFCLVELGGSAGCFRVECGWCCRFCVIADLIELVLYLLDEALFNRSWKLAPQRRSQRHMGGQMQQSNAAAATAFYDHAGGGTLHNAGPTNDAGDAVMARWLQSAGLQHLASPLADHRSLLMQVRRLIFTSVTLCFGIILTNLSRE